MDNELVLSQALPIPLVASFSLSRSSLLEGQATQTSTAYFL